MGLVSISISSILVRLAGDQPALSLAALRNIFAIAILTPTIFFSKNRTFFKLRWQDKVRIITAGILLGFHFYIFFEAIQRTTIASATVFVSATPIFLAILGYIFLREKLSGFLIGAIVVSVLGGLLMAYGDVGKEQVAVDPLMGNLLALAACLLVSIYLIIGRVVRAKLEWLAYVYPMYLSCAATVVTLAIFLDAPLSGFDWKIYLLCGIMAVGPHILGHGSFNYVVKYFSATFIGLLTLTEPIGATIMAFALFEELPAGLSIVGMFLTLVGVCMALYPGLRRSGGLLKKAGDTIQD